MPPAAWTQQESPAAIISLDLACGRVALKLATRMTTEPSATTAADDGTRMTTEPSATTTAADDDDALLCRYCFSGEEDGPLISPCACKGGQKFVHVECLRKWQRAVIVTQPTHPALYRRDERQETCNVLEPEVGERAMQACSKCSRRRYCCARHSCWISLPTTPATATA